MNINDKNFNGDELLNTFQTMSKEEAINLLGPHYSKILLDKLNSHTLTFNELEDICSQAYPTYKLRANWIRNIIHSKLDKYELLSIYGVKEEQIEQVRKIDHYKEKIKNSTLTEDELYELCCIVFDNESIRETAYQQLKEKLKSKAK